MKKISDQALNEIGFDSISIRIDAERSIEYISEPFENWEHWEPEENQYTRQVSGIIIGNQEFEKETVIGKLIGTFFEPEAQMTDMSFFDICDSMDGDLACMAEQVMNEDFGIREEICTINNSLFYLDEIFIDKPYREHGIGKYVLIHMDEFMLYTSNLDIGTIVTYPYAMEGTVEKGYYGIKEKEKRKETLKRLKKFYRSCGFKKVGTEGHMYKKYGDTFDYYQ